jgi:hypothetical protein
VPAPPEPPARSVERKGDIVRIGGGAVNVAENERVEGDVVAIGGAVTVDGEVTGDVVGVGGGLTLGPHAVVRGEVTAVGGPFKRDPQAQVFGQVNEIGSVATDNDSAVQHQHARTSSSGRWRRVSEASRQRSYAC